MVTLINKIECRYQVMMVKTFLSLQMQRRSTQIMVERLCICKDRKVFSSKVCIKLQRDRISFSGSKQYFLKVENIQITWECHFSLFKYLPPISLGLLVMETLYITNVFFFLIWQYFIDRLESILKLFQSVSNTLSKKHFLSCLYFLVWVIK